MKYELNSSLLPVISVAQYGTELDPFEIFIESKLTDDFKEGYNPFTAKMFYDNFDNKKWTKYLENIVKYNFNDSYELDGINVKLEFGEIYSPKYYNFANDNIDVIVTAPKGKLLRYAKANKDDFDEFLYDNYSTCDGFISFTANNYDEWLKDFKNNDVRAAGAILYYWFRIYNDVYGIESVFDTVMSEYPSASQFVNDTFLKEIGDKLVETKLDIKSLAQNYYGAKTVSDIVNGYFEHSYMDDIKEIDTDFLEKCKQIAVNTCKETFKEIDNQTLKLF